MIEYCVITFANTHSALSAEQELKHRIKIVILPTPREISKGCGIAIRFAQQDLEQAKAVLEELELPQDRYGFFRRCQDGGYVAL